VADRRGQRTLGSLRSLFRAEQSLLPNLERDVREPLASLSVRRVRIFGSVAPARERVGSDVDIYFEVSDDVNVRRLQGVLSSLTSRIGRKFGLA
jgi:predicted nucleotidyltransferase